MGTTLEIPVAHNEGNFFASKEMIEKLEGEGRIAFKYKQIKNNKNSFNPNGSLNDIAGILSKNGRVLGMMPHPERVINKFQGGIDGLKFLSTSIEHLVG